jgi:hypothetical protein
LSILRIGVVGRRDRVDEVFPLRREEGVARLEIVELVDRPSCSRPHPLDLGAEIRAPSRRA